MGSVPSVPYLSATNGKFPVYLQLLQPIFPISRPTLVMSYGHDAY